VVFSLVSWVAEVNRILTIRSAGRFIVRVLIPIP
jgi:hypothetical protein